MKTIKVKLTDPTKMIRAPRRILGREVVTGERVFDVPDVSFWHRRIKDGDLTIVEVVNEPAPAPTDPAPEEAPKAKSKRSRDAAEG